jgi:CubicO group peptidase (beta-lactamase class C family)
MSPSGVRGEIRPGYEAILKSFAAGVTSPSTSGAAWSVWHEGEEVVNLWAGTADARDGSLWAADTLQVIFSASKGLTAVVLMQMHERGELNIDAPIRSVWPQFAAHGKGDISIGDVLAHRAGVSAPREDLSLEEVLDSAALAERIAAQVPLWTPGAAHAYHAITYGTIAQEIVRRVDGRELHEVFQQEIASPLEADVSLKLHPHHLRRVARIETTPNWDQARSSGSDEDDAWIGRALTMGGAFPRPLVAGDEGFNDPRVILAGVAGAGGVGTASGLARIWSAVVRETRGVRLLNDASVARLAAVRSEGPWHFNPGPPFHRWGAGVQLSSDVTPWFSPDTLGHDGAGGQSGIADHKLGVALGYVTNHMDTVDRVAPIIEAFGSLEPVS